MYSMLNNQIPLFTGWKISHQVPTSQKKLLWNHPYVYFVSYQDGSLVDLSDQCLTKLEIPGNKDPVTVIADRNSISRIENLEQCQNLRQLSLAGNRLIHVNSLSKLRHLAVLNLPQNSIVSIEGLRELTELQWLNLSGNSIKSMDSLATNVAL